MVTSQFIPITGSAIPLESMLPSGSTDLEGVEIQTLTAGGATDQAYTWNTWMYENPCWVDGDLNPVEGVTFAQGDGLWVFGTSSEQSIQTSGQVGLEDAKVQLRSGGTATGNPFPVSVALTDILPVPFDAGVGADLEGIEIQTLTAGGATENAYTWNTWMYENPCWVDGDLNPVENVEFEAGKGLWIFGTGSDQAILFPAPEL